MGRRNKQKSIYQVALTVAPHKAYVLAGSGKAAKMIAQQHDLPVDARRAPVICEEPIPGKLVLTAKS